MLVVAAMRRTIAIHVRHSRSLNGRRSSQRYVRKYNCVRRSNAIVGEQLLIEFVLEFARLERC
jgi:hypothetical protein